MKAGTALSKNVIDGRGDDRDPSGGVPSRSVTLPDFDSFMQRVFEQTANGGGRADPNDTSLLRRDYETAFNLLQRASEAFPVLMRRCERLEGEMRDVRSQAQAEIAAAHGVTDQWHQLAAALKEKYEESERELEGVRQRLLAAEAEVVAGRRQIVEAEHQASVAVGITTLFHDKIVEAFGVGSPAHVALDLIARGEVERQRPPTG